MYIQKFRHSGLILQIITMFSFFYIYKRNIFYALKSSKLEFKYNQDIIYRNIVGGEMKTSVSWFGYSLLEPYSDSFRLNYKT